MKARILNRSFYWEVAVIAATAMLFTGIAMAEDSTEPRTAAISQGKGIQRGQLTDGAIKFLEHEALKTEGLRETSTKSSEQQKLNAAQAPNTDFWFFDATVDLFSDVDRDGYYFGLDLVFDADTVFTEADVYAVIYLSLEGGPWNELAETDVFTIFGAAAGDEYAVETELITGYPTGDYDMLIELFDTFDNSFVASIGPADTSELSFLPLEDSGRDTPVDTIIVVDSGGGGSLGWFTLLGLAGVLRFFRVVRAKRD